MSKPSRAPKRRRLDADTARTLILDATEKRLVVAGPAGIRLQEVAADAGVSHPTVLHHFGSRELLVKAVIARSMTSLNAMLVEALGASSGEDRDLENILENVAAALARTGHGRVTLWLLLEGHRIEDNSHLRDVVDAAHALRLSRKTRSKKPPREDTAHLVVFVTLALLAGPVLAPVLLENAGLGAGPKVFEAFRSWVVRLLLEHFHQ